MKDVKDITCLFIDHTLFLPLALRLGQTYKRVLYSTPWEKAFPLVEDCVIGDGFEEVERCDDYWQAVDNGEVDLVVCPDVMHAGLQLHFEKLGIPVWGSRKGDALEMNRDKFLRVLKDVGLDVPPYERVVGTTALADHLRDKEDVYIKISKYRGTTETKHFRSWALDQTLIYKLAIKFGPCREQIPFLVFYAIDTDIELGGDTYGVDGLWPSIMLQGYEWKDKGYFSAVTDKEKMPEDVLNVLEAFSPFLAQNRYRNQWSMEIRKTEDKAYFIDATCRAPSPATGSQIIAWSNFPEIIWAGANGELADPVPDCQFTAECVLTLKRQKGEWGETEIPAKLAPWMKLANCCCVDGVIGFPPDDEPEIGWLLAKGDTPEETVEQMKTHAAMLPDGVEAHLTSLVDLLKEIQEAEKQGIEFTGQSVPDPEVVVAD